MSRSVNMHDNPKISSAFASRLATLDSNQWVRVILMPAPYLAGNSGERAQGAPAGEERQTILRETRDRATASFSEVDTVLSATGGYRLTDTGNALGYVVVETTVAGVAALSELSWVGSLMEDQAVHPIDQTDDLNRGQVDCPGS